MVQPVVMIIIKCESVPTIKTDTIKLLIRQLVALLVVILANNDFDLKSTNLIFGLQLLKTNVIKTILIEQVALLSTLFITILSNFV